MNMSDQHVAVIGAGMAGLVLARDLVSSGASVSVFDKSRGVGGRMSTRRGEGWTCDHGAQYFTARSAEFRTEVTNWQTAGVVALWQPRLRVFEQCSVRDGRVEFPRFVGTPAMTAPARLIAEGLNVRLQSAIAGIEPEGQGFRLRTAEGVVLEECFDSVALAVPAPQVVPLLEALSPDMAALAAAARMQACWAVMLTLAQRPDIDFDAAFVNQGPLSWVARNGSKPERNGGETWLLHASPDWSEANLEASPEAVTHELLEAFVKLGAKVVPEASSTHRWRYAFTESAVAGGCVWDPVRRIGLCGDWLNGGRVEGAWLSGRALARQMLAAA